MRLLDWFKPSQQRYDERMDGWFDKSDEECQEIMDEITREKREYEKEENKSYAG